MNNKYMIIKIIKSANFIFNKCLKLDPQKKHLVETLQKKSLTIWLNDIDICILLTPINSNLIFNLGDYENAENILSANLSNIIAMGLANPQIYLQKPKFSFKGDFLVLKLYQQFFTRIRFDIVCFLSSGNIGTFISLLYQPLNTIIKWENNRRNSLAIEVREYIQYEKELIPCKEEVEDFFTDIQQIKQDVERIMEKLKYFHKLIG